ncbi:MAG: RDD family protein [bacterium]|nr:RDD family protein [bacterium]MDE0288680.1 RDD family protein [bacterium]MDE0439612.1 RDD family protein [bacterium]
MGSSPTEAGGAPVAMTGWVTLGNGEVRELASLGSRLGARILDWILVSVVIGVLAVIGIAGAIASGDEAGFIALVFGLALMVLVITLLYEMTMIALRGQTVGKMMVGAKVVRATDGEIPGWGKSIGRWLILVAPSLIPIGGFILTLLVYLSPTFDNRRQGWHDKAVATVVVKA